LLRYWLLRRHHEFESGRDRDLRARAAAAICAFDYVGRIWLKCGECSHQRREDQLWGHVHGAIWRWNDCNFSRDSRNRLCICRLAVSFLLRHRHVQHHDKLCPRRHSQLCLCSAPLRVCNWRCRCRFCFQQSARDRMPRSVRIQFHSRHVSHIIYRTSEWIRLQWLVRRMQRHGHMYGYDEHVPDCKCGLYRFQDRCRTVSDHRTFAIRLWIGST
jgi:hypothetical protein